jgi:hypothetical protein
MTALIIVAAIALIAAPFYLLVFALCRIAALSDEAARRMHEAAPKRPTKEGRR